jgi:hypothetical protein
MFVCQWHLDIPYGKQGEAVAVMRAWGEVAYRVIEQAQAGAGRS